ncbi:MAG: hypothetical protein DRO67_04020 [Candidatus Asgardarchaeum californiense]|nr:MAG: hypothetical protein DRO67_04020 [Candidatus Asgardarchaeum californiense]
MKQKNLKLSGLMLAGVIIIVSFVYAVNVQPVVIGDDRYFAPYSDLKTFSSYNELTKFLVDSSDYPSIYYDNSLRMWGMAPQNLELATTIDSAGSIKNGGAIVDYSRTNVQVSGVDEPDIVKTDGEYLYIVSHNKVIIVKATPAEDAKIECNITVNSSLTIQNIFIKGDRLVIFAQDYNYPIYVTPIIEPIVIDDVAVDEVEITTLPNPRWYSSPDTHIIIYDLEDMKNCEKVKDVVVPGYFAAARMIGDFVYLITTQYSYNIRYLEENQSIVPSIMVDDEVKEIPLSNIQYVEIPEESKTITNIVSVNVQDKDDDVTAKIFLLGNSQVLFVSHDNIYVTYSVRNYNYEMLKDAIEEVIMPNLPDSFKEELEMVNNLQHLTDYQKKTVTEWILQNYTNALSEDEKLDLSREINKRFERTTIHRIGISDGEIEYKAQGSIPGSVSNQFSLSEYDGHLRVSSTIQGWSISSLFSRRETQNNVYVLDMDLNLVGSLEGLAPGESIYATRFIGDKCYLVTFRQIDPFFVIDLKDPTDPTVLGELKIPGYSTYLHPYDETHVIGIGMEGRKVKISLFDVSDISNPVELSKYEIDNGEDGSYWGESYALNEHKAFLFDKEKNLLVIPAGNYNKQSAYVFDVTLEDGLELKGKITHESEEENENEEDDYYSYYRYDYRYSIKRSLYIDDVLYTISDNMVKMNSLEDLSEINSLNLN